MILVSAVIVIVVIDDGGDCNCSCTDGMRKHAATAIAPGIEALTAGQVMTGFLQWIEAQTTGRQRHAFDAKLGCRGSDEPACRASVQAGRPCCDCNKN